MTRQNGILLAVFGTLLVIALGLAGWLYLGNGGDGDPTPTAEVEEDDNDQDSDLVTDVTAEPEAPLPEVIATTEPEDETGESGESAETTPEPENDVVGDVGSVDTSGLDLSESPVLAELVEEYPELAALLTNLDITDEETLREVYRLLLQTYEDEGFRAMREVMGRTGLLTALKLDSAYLDFVLAYETDGFDAAVDLARERELVTENDELRLLLVLDTEDEAVIEAEVDPILEANNIVKLQSYGNEMEIGIPLDELEEATNSEDAIVRLVQLAYTPHVVGVRAPTQMQEQAVNFQIEGEGVARTGANPWHAAGFTGQGVKVGVIDPGGFGNYQALLGRDLPASVMTLQDPNALNNMDGVHGTGCAEIIYEMAPDAELYFAHAATDIELQIAVDWMIEQGVNIISHSAGTTVAPIDGTGPGPEAVKRATDAGIVWVNAAGNSAEDHLYMPFTDEDGDGFHEFPHGSELLPFDHSFSGGIEVILTWEDAWGGASQDFDLFIITESDLDREIDDWSYKAWNPQSGGASHEPYEWYLTELSNEQHYLVIQAYDVSRPNNLNLFTTYVALPYAHPQRSLTAPGDAPSSLTVAAVYWGDYELESYSSQGPTLDGRNKPEIAAPSVVSGNSYGAEGFNGTSAAAPHVAGAAALVMTAYPRASATDIRNYLIDNSVDAGPAGFDYGYGSGLLALGDAPTSADPPPRQGAATANINAIQMEHNIYVGQQKGMLIYTDFSISNMNQQRGFAAANFYDGGGNALADRNGEYADGGGNVASIGDFVPNYDDARFGDYPLFLPYSELELGAGRHDLSFRISILDTNGAALATSNPVAFNFSSDAGRLGNGAITDINVQHNVQRGGQVGMLITADFDVRNGAGQPAGFTAFFYFDDGSNRPLRDFNNRYRTQQGNVAVGETFTPNSDNESYNNFELFMPYDELHMDPTEGLRHNLKFFVTLTGGEGWRKLDASDWVAFWLQQ